MDWSNERYVRVYTRDTADWLAMRWEARALLPMMLRACDRSGVLQVKASEHRARLLSGLVHLPVEVVKPGLDDLLVDGCVIETPAGFVIRNFIEAQEAPQSDAMRSKELRMRRREQASETTGETGAAVESSRNVTAASQNVTDSHAGCAPTLGIVTPSVPSLPSRAVPEEEARALAPPVVLVPTAPAKKPRRPKPTAIVTPADQEVHDHWRKLYAPRAPVACTPARAALIQARRSERNPATAQQDLLDSLSGWKNDTWAERPARLGFELLLKAAANVDAGLGWFAQGPPKSPGSYTHAANDEWAAKVQRGELKAGDKIDL